MTSISIPTVKITAPRIRSIRPSILVVESQSLIIVHLSPIGAHASIQWQRSYGTSWWDPQIERLRLRLPRQQTAISSTASPGSEPNPRIGNVVDNPKRQLLMVSNYGNSVSGGERQASNAVSNVVKQVPSRELHTRGSREIQPNLRHRQPRSTSHETRVQYRIRSGPRIPRHCPQNCCP